MFNGEHNLVWDNQNFCSLKSYIEKHIMETNIEQNTDTEKASGFLHGGWIYLLFFALMVGVMIGISYLVKWLMA